VSAGPGGTVAPMLAKAVAAVPDQDSVEGGWVYEPKWDGFRGIVHHDGTSVEIGSRGAKPLTRYFPELVAALLELLPGPCVLDGEIVVRTGDAGRERLDWDALSQRIHPAESRVRSLAAATPASFVAFDLLRTGDEDLLGAPFTARRRMLEHVLDGVPAPVHLGRTTTDPDVARDWFSRFEGAGLDGVVAKPATAPYSPGARVMLKVKHHRTADVVVTGYRVHASGAGVGSLLLGLWTDDGELVQVGGASAFTAARRLELVDELAPFVERDDEGEVVTAERGPGRFSAGRGAPTVLLRPERVVEVRYDQMEGARFRHTVQVARWRDDREARSCGFDQLEVPVDWDLGDVLDRA